MEPLSPSARAALDAYRREHAPDPRTLHVLQHKLMARVTPTPNRAPLRLVAASTLTIAVLGVLGTRSGPVAQTLERDVVHEQAPPAAHAVVMPREASPAPVRATSTATATPSPRVTPSKVLHDAPDEPVAFAPAAPPPAESKHVVPRELPAVTARTARTESSTLDAEVMQLRTAHDLLRDGEPLRALSALREHARRFPDGKLHELAAVTRVLALCDAGQVDQAHRHASEFLSAHPTSIHASRVRDACRRPDGSNVRRASGGI